MRQQIAGPQKRRSWGQARVSRQGLARMSRESISGHSRQSLGHPGLSPFVPFLRKVREIVQSLQAWKEEVSPTAKGGEGE